MCVCGCAGQWTREGGPPLLVADAISRQLANQPLTLLKSGDLPPLSSPHQRIELSDIFSFFIIIIIFFSISMSTFGPSILGVLVFIGHLSCVLGRQPKRNAAPFVRLFERLFSFPSLPSALPLLLSFLECP